MMDAAEFWLPLAWAGLIGLAVVMYVVLDGFDLGIGILFPALPSDECRDTAMATVAPVWDGNETWLILGGGGLLAAFPAAYAIILSGTYIPILLMLIALIFRGVSFEFRAKARTSRHLWDAGFFVGSLLATFSQGLVLGTFIQGFPVDGNNNFVGGPFEWFDWFPLLCGVALVLGYALLAMGWLIWRTEGTLQRWSNARMRPTLLAVGVAIGIVSIATPLLDETIRDRWFGNYGLNLLLLAPIPIASGLLTWRVWQSCGRGHELTPFFGTIGLFVLAFLGLTLSIFPDLVPAPLLDKHETGFEGLSIWQAAAPPAAQGFALVGAGILVPVILGYTIFTYWVFRGKVTPESGYHH